MKIGQYLLYEHNKEYKTPRALMISEKEFNTLAETQYSDAFNIYIKTKQAIYRGDAQVDYLYAKIIEPDKIERVSAFTYNYYTWMINYHPAWSEYPKRSIICSTAKQGSESYGTLYRIYPQNGTKIGICPSSDIWDSFNSFLKGHSIVYKFTDVFYNLFMIFKLPSYHSTVEKFKADLDILLHHYGNSVANFINEILSLGINVSIIDFWIKVFEKVYKERISLWDYLGNVLLNPDKNNFRIISEESKVNKVREVWFNSSCIMEKVK